VDAAALVPWGHWWTTGPSGVAAAGYYAVVFFLFAYPLTRTPPRWGLAGCLSFLSLAWVVPEIRFAATASQEVRATFIDVGHGGATLIQLPNRQHLLFDAGSMEPPGFAAAKISGVLWEAGVHHLEAVIISHDDLDHYSALDRLAEKFSIGRVYLAPSIPENPSEPLQVLLRRLKEQGIDLQLTWAGQQVKFESGAVVEILHPPREAAFESDNAGSLVAEIRYREQRLLLTADVEGRGLEQLLKRRPAEHVAAMVPHHGSRFGDPVNFSRWASAPHLVICDGNEPEWADSADVARIQASGSKVWITGRDGAVRVRLWGEGFLVENWRHQRWSR
jgi:competence protein ComEC